MLPEMGPVPPYDIRPQYEAMTAVYRGGLPVPKIHWLEMDSGVLGHHFLVMDKVDGEVMMSVYPREPQSQAQLKQEYIDYLAKVHALDWGPLNFSALQPPQSDRQHAEREIERWQWVMERNQYGPQPLLAEALVWLKNNIPPAERTSLCHGDYAVANMFCRDGHIVAIFDWELASLGDPVSDLGYVCMWSDTLRLGFWDEKEFIRAYEKASGVKVSEGSFFFWKLLSYVKMAVIGLGAIRTALESEKLEVHQFTFLVLSRRILKGVAEMLGF
jgi:aminoglycoside phosphotransferase (APT) family kinase protein